MRKQKYLIDTNVFFGLEDEKEIPPLLATLTTLANRHGVRLFVHEAARDDIASDVNPARRAITLSKADKFQRLKKVRGLSQAALELQFGPLKKRNDVVDATLLHALSIGAADFLVTEDRKLHARARRYPPEIAQRVLFIADAVSLLKTTYEEIRVSVRYVQEVLAYEIPLQNEIFDSLREGYPEFDQWWRDKCVNEHRECWVVYDGGIAALAVRKDESQAETDAKTKATKILKICTFKVRPEKRGIKLGELLLRQIFWFAQTNGYDLVYLTTYPDQQALIDLLEYYGFSKTHESQRGELTYEKCFSQQKLVRGDAKSLFDLARQNYPRFLATADVPAYGVPIQERYHDQLFPDLKTTTLQPDLFEEIGLTGGPKRPGNTIRKVYLSRAKANLTDPGALLYFYKGKSKQPPSQSMTVVGIFEDVRSAHSTEELKLLTGGRSVYSEAELKKWGATARRPVKVMNFLLAGYIKPPAELRILQKDGIFVGHPPQSIFRLIGRRRRKILRHLKGDFGI